MKKILLLLLVLPLLILTACEKQPTTTYIRARVSLDGFSTTYTIKGYDYYQDNEMYAIYIETNGEFNVIMVHKSNVVFYGKVYN